MCIPLASGGDGGYSSCKPAKTEPSKEVESMAKDTNGYLGKIQNTGGQRIEAVQQTTAAKKGVVKRGNDLRVKGGR